MALGNYTELKDAMADWLVRSDLTDRIPDFISLAEGQFNRNIRHRSMMARADATLTASEGYIALPSDYRQMITLTLETDPRCVLNPMNKLDQDRRAGNQTGKPRMYYVVGDEIRFGPAPDSDYGVGILYYQDIPALSDTQTNNWLLTGFPDIYLYGSLIHSAPYLRDDNRVQLWYGFYNQALEELDRDSKNGLVPPGSAMRLNMRVT